MAFMFDSIKATEATAYLLRRRGGRMSYLKLIKLLYLADREALNRWGIRLTTDRHVSMPKGPVVSNIYNLIIGELESPYWSAHISPPVGSFEIELRDEPCSTGRLSRAEESLLYEIFDQYGHMNRWDLVKFTHNLPEWQDPNGSSLPISIEEILRVQCHSDEDIAILIAEFEADHSSNEALQSVLG